MQKSQHLEARSPAVAGEIAAISYHTTCKVASKLRASLRVVPGSLREVLAPQE